jgi:hypothetical protein
MTAPLLTFGTFTGDRDSKTADILKDGKVVGYIEREYNDGAFQSAASFNRTRRYAGTRVVLFDREDDIEIGCTTIDADTKAAKAKAREVLA